jgi:hypothetical protein
MDDSIQDGPPQGAGDGHSFFQNFQHTPIGARVPEKVSRGVFTTGLMILQTNELFVLDFLSMGSPPPQIVSRIIMVAPHFAQFVGALRANIDHYESQFGPIRSHGPAGSLADMPSMSPNSQHSSPMAKPPANVPAEEVTAGFTTSYAAENLPLAGGEGPFEDPMASENPHSKKKSKTPQDDWPPSRHGPPPEMVTDLYEQVKFPEELMPGSFSDAVMIRHSPEEFGLDFICSLYPRPIVVSRIYLAAGRARGMLETVAGALERFERFGPPPPPSEPSE